VRLLAELGASLEAKSACDGETALCSAAYWGHGEVARQLVELDADLEVEDKDGQTPLLIAASGGYPEVVRQLGELGADLEAKDRGGRTALIAAADRGQADSVRQLAKLGADLEAKDRAGRTALSCAAWGGRVHVVQHLAELGVDLDAKDNDGATALARAASHHHINVVRQLAELGASLEVKGDFGEEMARVLKELREAAPRVVQVSAARRTEGAEEAMAVTCTQLSGTVVATISLEPKDDARELRRRLADALKVPPAALQIVLPSGVRLRDAESTEPLQQLLMLR